VSGETFDETQHARRNSFPAKRREQDVDYFRRSEASKTQIIFGEAKQARRKLFPAKRLKRDANHFRRNQASKTQIISGDAKQARRKSFPVTQNKRDANYFWRSEDSETQIIFGEAQHARRNSFPAKRSEPDVDYFRRSEASKTQIIFGEAKQARRKLFPAKRSMIGAQGNSERSERRIGRSELFGAATFRLRTPFVFSDKSFGRICLANISRSDLHSCSSTTRLAEIDGSRERERIVQIQRYGRLRLIKGYPNLGPDLKSKSNCSLCEPRTVSLRIFVL
jgi:hypothetical protein